MPDFERMARIKGDVSIVGVGDTDYAADYARSRSGAQPWQDCYGYGAEAFRAALADCGLRHSDIDGLVVGPTLSSERGGEILGINPRWSAQADAVNAIILAALAIHSGLAECVALVYGNDQRTAGTTYGGPAARGDNFLSYVYYRLGGSPRRAASTR
jgi:hypothetical protein